MPIEYGDVEWPPAQTLELRSLCDEYGAWYVGKPDKLRQVYAGLGAGQYPNVRPSQRQGGIVGMVSRAFWGRPIAPGQNGGQLHIPAASDISMLSADLLFGERPNLRVESTTLQESLERLTDECALFATLTEAAEQASAYGGVYLRAMVDVSVADVPLVDVVLPDVAVPDWYCGRLQAVTFWREVSEPLSTVVLRHLERHEPGVVYHALFQGSADKLGRRVPLNDAPETARFARLVDAHGAIATGVDRLDVVYWPNMRPNRDLRAEPSGRSDYSGGVTAMMGALDETWSAWMRDIRLGKARIHVPREYMRSLGAGLGASFNPEQEIYEAVQSADPDKPLQITATQFAIRVEEHSRTAGELFKSIMRSVGLSSNAFGEEASGPAITAKEHGGRQERTNATRQRKISYAKPAVRQLALLLLALDQAHFGGPTPEPVEAEWPDTSAPDPETLARTIQYLDAAQAVSDQTKIEMLHPDWDDAQIAEEVGRIAAARPVMADPATFTGAPTGDTPTDEYATAGA